MKDKLYSTNYIGSIVRNANLNAQTWAAVKSRTAKAHFRIIKGVSERKKESAGGFDYVDNFVKNLLNLLSFIKYE